MPDANGNSPAAADLANLHDLNSQLWGSAHRLASQAQDVAVLLIAKIIRHHEPTARYLELTESTDRPDGFVDGEVYDDDHGLLIDATEDAGDLTGPEGSTNSVFGLVCELDKDAAWRRFVVYAHPSTGFHARTNGNALLDLAAVLAEEEAIRR